MYKYTLAIWLSIIVSGSFAQSKPGTSFYGETKADVGVCPQRMGALTDEEVNGMITDMLDRYGLRSRFIIMPCSQIDNCQATLHQGKPYILYNSSFLNEVKRLNFSEKIITTSEKNWKTLTILAHEIGHHLNNHLSNPLPNARQIDMELEADQTAGFIIYLMGGTLTQAQFAFSNVSENGSYTHPGRKERLDAVAKGWNNALNKYPKGSTITPVSPGGDITSVTDWDANVYKTVKIKSHIWMAENLNVSHFKNGDPIYEAKTSAEWVSAGEEGIPAWCYYNNDPSSGKKYGKLYNWYAVNDSRGLAPQGWSVPTNEVLSELISGTDKKEISTSLRSQIGWSGLGNGNNKTGFAALPGGYRSNNGGFSGITSTAVWWTISKAEVNQHEYKGIYKPLYYILKADDIIYKATAGEMYGHSVRCVKD